jgi:acyl carrier protein
MHKYLQELAEILEEKTIQLDDVLQEFEAWDSLTVLSMMVWVDEKTGHKISAREIHQCVTVQDLLLAINKL